MVAELDAVTHTDEHKAVPEPLSQVTTQQVRHISSEIALLRKEIADAVRQ